MAIFYYLLIKGFCFPSKVTLVYNYYDLFLPNIHKLIILNIF